jgi:AcrR family transcriptional regulator
VAEGARHDIPVPSGGQTSRTAPKLDRLLTVSAELMATRGFSQTSIRDVATASGFSLGGMYYYFKNKEDLLFQIQQRTFSNLLAVQENEVAAGGEARSRLRRIIRNHLAYFTSHFAELKVCTFELESLQGGRYTAIAGLRRRYFDCLAAVIGELLGVDPANASSDGRIRHKTLFVFGMLNWIFMWYDPERDSSVEALGDEMVSLVLDGLNGKQPG